MQNDYGKPYRQLFLDQERDEARSRRLTYALLYTALVYFGGHILYALIR